MNEKTVAAVALSNREYESLEEKLLEAAEWVEHAAKQGADLVVLPEALSNYGGDGAGNPRALRLEDTALDDWQSATSQLLDAAVRHRIAVTVPVVVREADCLRNCFFLVSATGSVAGCYQKMRPTERELQAGVRPGKAAPFAWEGLLVGGAICWDSEFPEVFSEQAQLGADLFLMPSLWPGGDQLNFYAFEHAAPIVLSYPAWSRIIDTTGNEIAAAGYRWETLRFGFGSPVALARINFDRVTLFANENQFKMVEIEKKYGSRIRVTFNQQNASFFLESRDPDLPVADVVREFDLISRREYLNESRRQIMDTIDE